MTFLKLKIPGTDVEFLIHSRHVNKAWRPSVNDTTTFVFVDGIPQALELMCVLKPTETAIEHLRDQS